MKRVGLGLVLVLSLSSSCGGSDETEEDLPPPTYANFGREFLTTFCTRCHGPGDASPEFANAGGDPNLTLFEAAADEARCGVAPTTLDGCGPTDPPAGMLPAAEPRPDDATRLRFVEWVDAGLP